VLRAFTSFFIAQGSRVLLPMRIQTRVHFLSILHFSCQLRLRPFPESLTRSRHRSRSFSFYKIPSGSPCSRSQSPRFVSAPNKEIFLSLNPLLDLLNLDPIPSLWLSFPPPEVVHSLSRVKGVKKDSFSSPRKTVTSLQVTDPSPFSLFLLSIPDFLPSPYTRQTYYEIHSLAWL